MNTFTETPLKREMREEREAESTYSELFGELYAALVQCDPGRMVNGTPAHDCVYDEMAGRDGDEMRSRITYLIGAAMVSKDPDLQQFALKLGNDLAANFASYREGL